jgi:two-component system sensor histidine kinase YesM
VSPVPGEVLVLEVRDDGAGMTPRSASPRASQPSRGRGPESLHRIGIANVERRIALNFGAPYGLAIDSEPGAFTCVRIVLPALARIESGEFAREDSRGANRA